MKIGIIGTTSTVDAVTKVLQEDFPDIEYTPAYTELLEDHPEAVQKLEQDTDAILFSGPNNYRYTAQRLTRRKIPWAYLPHNRVSAMQALLQASTSLKSSLQSLSLDSYAEQPIRQALTTAGIKNTLLFKFDFDPENQPTVEELFQFHISCSNKNHEHVCLTSFGYCYDMLSKAGIPCIRILPAPETIREQIYYLQLQVLAQQDRHGNIAVIAILYNYLFDNEKDLVLREWEKIRYQNSIKEHIYNTAHKLQGAVFQDDMVPFFIVTSKEMLDKIFFQQQEQLNLLHFGQQTRRFRLCLGIGIGSTMLEAKSRSTMALNHAFQDKASRTYIAENEQEVAIPAFSKTESQAEKLQHLAKQCGVSVFTLERLKQAIAITGNTVTVEALAPHLGVSIRSINRLLSKLEDSGCITIISKSYNGKGRPARVMRIILP